jgi:hypothetical protein
MHNRHKHLDPLILKPRKYFPWNSLFHMSLELLHCPSNILPYIQGHSVQTNTGSVVFAGDMRFWISNIGLDGLRR